MILFLLILKDSLYLQNQVGENKFGLLFYKNVGQNLIKTMEKLLEDSLMKFYMHFQEHRLIIEVFQKLNKNKMHFGWKS
jgi:hypothetical protein